MDTVRVLRILEYVGPRDLVEEQLRRSINGERNGMIGQSGTVIIRATTLGSFPEIMAENPLEVRGDI